MTRYELLDRIGVGGMAEIFRGKAVAAGGFEKPVAIKRILPHLSQDPRFVELLIAEAKVLSLLKHRNIVQIFDVGLGDDSKYFLVMEYVDGKDLGAIQRGLESRRARMAFDLALHVIAEVCEALEHAHTARAPDGKPMALVHRDISPSNVLVSRAGEIKLTDFGIAKRAEQEPTRHGGVRGKFAYISPEQARNEHVSPRSDVFAVGVLLWELLANRRLFSGLGDLEALRAVRDAAIQPPSALEPTVPEEADAIVMGALARDPARRPTAGQLGQQLRALRYSLDDTSGDPATELAKVIGLAEQVEQQSRPAGGEAPASASASASVSASSSASATRVTGFEADAAEMTVIRIRTADAFTQRNELSISMAREVIDRFEEEETRMAQLSAPQLAQLRARDRHDSGEVPVPPPRPAPRARRHTEEPTILRPAPTRPMLDESDGDGPTVDSAGPIDPPDPIHPPPNLRFDPDEATRLVAPRDRRGSTPLPERVRGPSRPPPRPPTASSPPPPIRRAPEPMIAAGSTLPIGQLLVPPQAPPPPKHPGMLTTQLPAPPPPPAYAPGYVPPPAPTGYPMFHPAGRAATPTSPDAYDRPPAPRPAQGPPVSGFRPGDAPPASALRPWMLVVGALLMAGLAFALTRAFIH